MNQYTSKYFRILLVIPIIFFAIIGAGCDNQKNSPENKEMAKEFTNKLKELISKPNQEAIALLSVKYGNDANIVEKIIDQYLMETDFFYRMMQKPKDTQRSKKDFETVYGILDKSAYIELINHLSTKFSVEPSKVASILLDYKLWDIAKEAAESKSTDD
jgi:hypothetical protein